MYLNVSITWKFLSWHVVPHNPKVVGSRPPLPNKSRGSSTCWNPFLFDPAIPPQFVNTFFKSSVTRAAGSFRIFFSSCPSM